MSLYFRGLVVALAVVVLATACSDGNFEPEPLDDSAARAENGVDRDNTNERPAGSEFNPALEDLTAASLDLVAETLADGPLSADELAQVTSWFDAFLQTRDLYFVGRATRDDIAAYTIDRGFLTVAEETRGEYIKLLEQDTIIAVTEFASFSNIKQAVASRGQITFTDCTEQQRLSTIGIVSFRWVEQQIVLNQVDEGWTISQIDVLHDGEPWTPPYGCAPDSFQQRAVGLAQELMEENRSYQQNPDSLPTEGAFPSLDDPLMRQVFTNAIVAQQDENLAIASPEEFRYTVQGIDVGASLIDWVVAVDVCSLRPEGLVYTTNDTDQITQDPDVGRNFSLGYQLLVALEPVEEGVSPTDKIVAVEIGEIGCW